MIVYGEKNGKKQINVLPIEWVLGLREHPSSELFQTDAEKNVSQALLLTQIASDALESGDYNKALQTLQQMSRLTPDDSSTWAGLGELYLHFNRLDNALGACQKAVRLGPEQADSWSCLGDFYESSGQYPEAEKALKRAVDLEPNEPVNWLGLGRVLAEENKRIGVMTIYDRLKALDHNYADQYFRLFVKPILESPNR